MPKGVRIPEKVKEQIRHDKLTDPDVTHQELADKYHISRSAVTTILNHQVIHVIKKSQAQARELGEITQVDDLLLILSDVIFKLKYDNMDATQARALGYLVKTYFELLCDRGKAKLEDEGMDLSSLSIEELKVLASDQT